MGNADALPPETAPVMRPAVVPEHGRGVLRPFQPCQSGNPSGRSGPYRETQRLARDAAPAVTCRLIEIALTDADTRVAVVAGNSVLDRAFGKPRDYDPKEDRPAVTYDTSGFTRDERVQLLALLRKAKLLGADAGPLAQEIEGQAKDQGR
jgi:hypothetical protein